MDLSEQPSWSAALRRRQRRLRSWLRHERMTVAMALVERTHHSSRGQTIARVGVWGREMNHTATIQDIPTPQPEFFSLEEEPGGVRPDRLFAVSGPQARVQRRTVQQIVDFAPLPTLDDPVPQTAEQLPDVLQFFDAPVPDPERVVEVPKILPEDVPVRTPVREPQLAEQLVEEPTIISFSSLQRTMEQHVDSPVPGRGGRIAGLQPVLSPLRIEEQIVGIPVPRGGVRGLQGFLQGQDSTTSPLSLSLERISERNVEQIVDSPVVGGGLQDFRPGQGSTALHGSPERISERIVEQIVDILSGGLQDFRPSQGSSASSSSPAGVHSSADVPGEGFFRTFPKFKKSAKVGPHSGSELSVDFVSSTPAAHVGHWVDGDDDWIRIDSVHGPFWKRLLSDLVQWHPPWERH